MIVRLREELTSDSNVDLARPVQLKESEDIQEATHQAELTAINCAAYKKVTKHLA